MICIVSLLQADGCVFKNDFFPRRCHWKRLLEMKFERGDERVRKSKIFPIKSARCSGKRMTRKFNITFQFPLHAPTADRFFHFLLKQYGCKICYLTSEIRLQISSIFLARRLVEPVWRYRQIRALELATFFLSRNEFVFKWRHITAYFDLISIVNINSEKKKEQGYCRAYCCRSRALGRSRVSEYEFSS